MNKQDIIEQALRLVAESFKKGAQITSAEDAKNYLQLKTAGYENEIFTVIFLDSQNCIISCDEMFNGTICATNVHPREVAKRALQLNAAAVIFSHNHPSGNSACSQADIDITKRLRDALELIDVRVLDHLVVGSTVTSMAEIGII